MKLISMTAFVQQELKGKVLYHHLEKVVNYSDFLIQKFKIWMFVPCKLVGSDWVVLEEPLQYRSFIDLENEMDDDIPLKVLHNCKEYHEAKKRCLFEGFEYFKTNWDLAELAHLGKKENSQYVKNKNTFCQINIKDFENKTIENLVQYNLELTPTAQKQFGF
jgi:hypothetical protein